MSHCTNLYIIGAQLAILGWGPHLEIFPGMGMYGFPSREFVCWRKSALTYKDNSNYCKTNIIQKVFMDSYSH